MQLLTKEQNNLIRFVRGLAGIGATYTWLYYEGAIAGSEFLTYNAKKLYIAFEIDANHTAFGANAAPGYINFYNELNALCFAIDNNYGWYNSGTAAREYSQNSTLNKNLYFSRVVNGLYTTIKFNGLRVVWP